jgi:hypothetical protein
MIDQLLKFAKTAIPGFDTQPLAQQSAGPHGVVRILTGWLQGKKQRTMLEDDESELVLMIKEEQGNLLMIPVILNNDENPRLTRALLPESINVEQMSQRIPVIDLLPILIQAGKEKDARDIKLSQKLIAALQAAANHPDCRLVVEQPSATDDVLEEIHTKTPQEQPNVDALGATEKETGGRITDAERYGDTGIEWLVGKDAVERTTEEIQAPYREDDPNSPDFFIGGDRVLVFDDEEVLELTVPLLASKHEVLKMAFEHEEGAEFYAEPPFNPEKTVVWMVGQHTDNGTSDQILSRYKEDTDSGNCYVGGDRVLNFDEDQSFNLTVPLQATRHEVLKIAFETEPGVRFYAEPPFNPANNGTPGVAQTNQEPTS